MEEELYICIMITLFILGWVESGLIVLNHIFKKLNPSQYDMMFIKLKQLAANKKTGQTQYPLVKSFHFFFFFRNLS